MIFLVIARVFQRPFYAFIGVISSFTVFVLAIWLPNIRLVAQVLFSSGSVSERISLPIALLGSVFTNFSTLSALYVVIMAVLFGVNVALVVFFLGRRIASVNKSGLATGFIGVVSGTLGVGCAACGSLLVTVFLTWIGTGAFIRFMPFRGEEFGIAGVILLAVSVFLTAKRIKDPVVCKI